eukprot:345381_1
MSTIISYFILKNPLAIYSHAPPIHYNSPDKNTEHIIITPQYQNESIYIYNIHNDTFSQKFRYPSNFKPTDHINALNTHSNELYVLGGFFSIFGSVNLKTEKWNIQFYDGTKAKDIEIKQQLNINDYNLCFPYFINKTELHVFHRGKHLMYDTNYNKFIMLSSNNHSFTQYGKLLYVKHLSSKLMLFGGDNPIKIRKNANKNKMITSQQQLNIYFLDTKNRSFTEYTWELFDIKLKNALDYELCHIVLVYDYIVILFDLERNIINCLDLLLTKQWYLSELEFPSFYCGLKSVYTVVDNKNYIHFIRCKTSMGRDGFHIKVSAKQCIPMKLVEIYEKYYEKLVIGYIKSRVQHVIPIPLRKIIFRYFPRFL